MNHVIELVKPIRAEPAEASPRAVQAYLASLTSPNSRRAMRSALDQIARVLIEDRRVTALSIPWEQLRYEHMAALRARLAENYAPASANTMLAAVRGVLRNAWRLGQIDTDTYLRTIDVGAVPGTRLPAGRALNAGEIRALFAVCAADPTPAGSRDAAHASLEYSREGLNNGPCRPLFRPSLGVFTAVPAALAAGNRGEHS